MKTMWKPNVENLTETLDKHSAIRFATTRKEGRLSPLRRLKRMVSGSVFASFLIFGVTACNGGGG